MRRAVGLFAASLLLASCNPGALEAQPFEGIWQSEGWGTFLIIGGDVEVFEHTTEHCLSLGTAGARGITDSLSFEGDRLLLRDADREIRFDRLDVLPITCADAQTSSDPVLAVTVLAATIEEHLVGDLDTGWNERRADVVSRAGTGEDLRDLVIDLIAPFGGRVRFASEAELWPGPPAPARPEGYDLGDVPAYALGDLDGTGFLSLSRTGPFDTDPDASEGIAGRIVDQVTQFETVILDLRASSGGSLSEALLFATRFVPDRRTVGSLEARAGEGFVPAGVLSVTPLPTGTFAGDVFVLVGPETRGPGELLAHILGDLERVTILGSPTAGDPGPALIRYLPNVWSISLPNLQVVGPDGVVLGSVIPDIETEDPLTEALRLAG
jgi:hypothetical protein